MPQKTDCYKNPVQEACYESREGSEVYIVRKTPRGDFVVLPSNIKGFTLNINQFDTKNFKPVDAKAKITDLREKGDRKNADWLENTLEQLAKSEK